jgi:cell wall-associated NlpC family hydrolase
MRAPDLFDIAGLVGAPFRYGARGPAEFDCYGLVMHLHALQGQRLPDYRSPSEQPRIAALMATQLHLWEEVPAQPGAVVALRLTGELVSHCGLVLADGQKFVHAWEACGGVTIERLAVWQRAHRVAGFYQFRGPQ